MNLKVHFPHLDYFSANLRTVGEEQMERFRQEDGKTVSRKLKHNNDLPDAIHKMYQDKPYSEEITILNSLTS